MDELEWLVGRGCHLFMFNESDLGGMPERVMEICDEIIRRGLHRKVKLTGQLRVNRKQNRAFFEKLREANFVALRFGIDAFSERTLRLQMKGYTVDMITQNLKDCWEVGTLPRSTGSSAFQEKPTKTLRRGSSSSQESQVYRPVGKYQSADISERQRLRIDRLPQHCFEGTSGSNVREVSEALPADQWHSTDPEHRRAGAKERFERIVLALHDAGFNVGAWANRVIEDVKLNRDKARTGTSGTSISAGEFEIASGTGGGAASKDSEEQVALDASSRRAPLTDLKPSRTAKSLPMLADADMQREDAARPPAEPPLFGIAGHPPRLVRKMDAHTIIFYDGWYYGIPAALSNVDVTIPESAAIAGILRYPTEEEVTAAIESARWANSRGHYDDQKKQRASGSYMRVDSVGEMSKSAEVLSKPRILQFGNMHIAVDQEVLKNPFDRKSFVESKCKSRRESKRNISIWRRMAELLPASFEEEIRRLIRQERFNRRNGGYLSDLQLARMLPHAAAVTYVKEPLKRIMRLVTDEFRQRNAGWNTGEREEFSILSVVTKNAQPELL